MMIAGYICFWFGALSLFLFTRLAFDGYLHLVEPNNYILYAELVASVPIMLFGLWLVIRPGGKYA